MPLNNGDRSQYNLCVFCASSDSIPEEHSNTARNLAKEMARRNIRLVFGGGNNGLMGVLSETLHDAGGVMAGVITRLLRDIGDAYDKANEMIVTEGMHERKAVMYERADGFLALPGGFGTLEELLEIITHKQLAIHHKPIVILNVHGFYDSILAQFEKAYEDGFVDERNRELYFVAGTVDEALSYLEKYAASENGNDIREIMK